MHAYRFVVGVDRRVARAALRHLQRRLNLRLSLRRWRLAACEAREREWCVAVGCRLSDVAEYYVLATVLLYIRCVLALVALSSFLRFIEYYLWCNSNIGAVFTKLLSWISVADYVFVDNFVNRFDKTFDFLTLFRD